MVGDRDVLHGVLYHCLLYYILCIGSLLDLNWPGVLLYAYEVSLIPVVASDDQGLLLWLPQCLLTFRPALD